MTTYRAKTLLSPRQIGLGIEGQIVAVPHDPIKSDIEVWFQDDVMKIRKGSYPVHEQTFKHKFVQDKTYTLWYFVWQPEEKIKQLGLNNMFEGADPAITETPEWKALKVKLKK